MRLVLVLLIALLFAAPAHAAPRALATLGENEGFVLSGDRVVFARDERPQDPRARACRSRAVRRRRSSGTRARRATRLRRAVGRFAGRVAHALGPLRSERAAATTIAGVHRYGHGWLERRRRLARSSGPACRSNVVQLAGERVRPRSSAPGTGPRRVRLAVYEPRAPRAAVAGRHPVQRRPGHPQRTGAARQGAAGAARRDQLAHRRAGHGRRVRRHHRELRGRSRRARPRHGRRHAARGGPGRHRHAPHARGRRAEARRRARAVRPQGRHRRVRAQRDQAPLRCAHRAARALRHRRRQRAVERERLPAARADHRPGGARPRPGPVRAQ